MAEPALNEMNGPFFSTRWLTKIPDRGHKTQSEEFFLDSDECQLELKVLEGEIKLDVKRTDDHIMAQSFDCTVLVECELDMKLTAPTIRKSIDLRNECLWSHAVSDDEVSKIVGKVISFIVVLEENENTILEEGDRMIGEFSRIIVRVTKSMRVDFAKLLDEDVYKSDIQLLCGDLTIPAHGAILSARSDVLQKMLQTEMLEKCTGTIKIPDIAPSVVKEFLRYIYTDTLPGMTVEVAKQLYEAGVKYNVKSLVRDCGDFLSNNLTPDNFCDILVLAEDHSDSELKLDIIRYLLKNKVPSKRYQWKIFSNKHPKLANDVLYSFYESKDFEEQIEIAMKQKQPAIDISSLMENHLETTEKVLQEQ